MGHVVLAKAPLVEPDPLADGALLRLALDGTSLLDVAIPAAPTVPDEEGRRLAARCRRQALDVREHAAASST